MTDGIKGEPRIATGETAHSNSAQSWGPRNWCFALGVLAAAAGFSGWMTYPGNVVPVPNNGLVVAENELDFGQAWGERAFPWKFTIHNPTATDITINRFYSSCSCAKLTPESLTIPANSKADVNLTLNLSTAYAGQPSPEVGESSAARPFNAEIMPDIGNGAAQKWHVKGKVARVLVIERQTLYMDDGLVHGQPHPKSAIKFSANTVLAKIDAVCPNEHCRPSIERSGGGPGEWLLRIDVAPTMPVGPFECDIALKPYGSFGMPLPGTSLKVKGIVNDHVTIVPSELLLGVKQLGETVNESIFIRQNNGANFRFVSLEHTSTKITATSLDERSQLSVNLRIDEPGQVAHKVHFVFSPVGGGPEIRIPFGVSYFGRERASVAK